MGDPQWFQIVVSVGSIGTALVVLFAVWEVAREREALGIARASLQQGEDGRTDAARPVMTISGADEVLGGGFASVDLHNAGPGPALNLAILDNPVMSALDRIVFAPDQTRTLPARFGDDPVSITVTYEDVFGNPLWSQFRFNGYIQAATRVGKGAPPGA